VLERVVKSTVGAIFHVPRKPRYYLDTLSTASESWWRLRISNRAVNDSEEYVYEEVHEDPDTIINGLALW